MGAHAHASMNVPRMGGAFRPLADLTVVVSDVIADGMGWLISSGLVGPSAMQSGSSAEWRITSAVTRLSRTGPHLMSKPVDAFTSIFIPLSKAQLG